jgi:RNA polymerase sigma-54 factor
MIDQSLQLRLAQKLALAPQLQQAIRLLQLNRIELREYIQEAVDSNPLLETEEPEQDTGSEPLPSGDPESNTETTDDYSDFGAESWSEDQPGAEYWQENSGYSEAFSDAQIPDQSGNSLHEHLMWQINLSHFSPTDEEIAMAIVYALDDEGFLDGSLEDIRISLAPELLVESDEILAVLHRVQRMEPVGVASRDPGECIGVQLSALPADTPGRDLARRLVRDFLDMVANHQVDELARETSASVDALEEALDLIRSLEPRPGARFDNRRDEYLAPDIYVRKLEGEWVVTLSPDNDPGLRLNKYYVSLLRQSGKKDADYLRGRLQEARWLLSSLELRNRTLVKVARCIVERQEGFMEEGDIAMKPMILKEVAELVGVHESTVSRATTRKYMLTPRGLYELKHFFSSHVKTRSGGLVSATAIKARLQILFANEPISKPLSDQEISQLLLDADICAARRTVAKYRESLGIGSSSERRRAYRRLAAQQAVRAD